MSLDRKRDLEAFLLRQPPYDALIGGGVRTYPGGDAEQQRLFDSCRALECRGIIRRVWQKNYAWGAVVYFEAR